MSNPVYETFDHEADIGVRGIGPTKSSAFEQAALAMTSVIVEPEEVAPRFSIRIECEAPDDELLLVDWLNRLVYEMATRHALFGRFAVELSNHHLTAIAEGESVDRERHQPTVEVKGATYNELAVRQIGSGLWLAQCVVDV
jgi:SHS2 domain-containing protein